MDILRFQSRCRDLEESDGDETAYAIKCRRIYFNPVIGIQFPVFNARLRRHPEIVSSFDIFNG